MDKKILLVLFLLLGAALAAAWLRGNFSAKAQNSAKVHIGTFEYDVEIADTIPAQARGLSGREDLAEGHGMLFVFHQPRSEAFWMHDMNFPIDIVWIADGRVTGVVHRAPVQEGASTPTFNSPGIVDHVLEVPAGTALRNGIVVGSEVTISGYDTGN